MVLKLYHSLSTMSNAKTLTVQVYFVEASENRQMLGAGRQFSQTYPRYGEENWRVPVTTQVTVLADSDYLRDFSTEYSPTFVRKI